MSALKQRRYDQAIKLFTLCISEEPDISTHYLRATAHDAKGSVGLALADYIVATGSLSQTIKQKSLDRSLEICTTYCHIDCSGVKLSPENMQVLAGKRQQRDQALRQNDPEQLRQFLQSNCGRDADLNKKLLTLAIQHQNQVLLQQAYAQLKVIYPQSKHEFTVLNLVSILVEQLGEEKLTEAIETLATTLKEEGDATFQQIQKLIRTIIDIQQNIEQNQTNASAIQALDAERAYQLFTKLETTANSLISQTPVDYGHYSFRHIANNIANIITSLKCFAGIVTQCQGIESPYTHLKTAQEKLHNLKQNMYNQALDAEQLEKMLGEVIDSLKHVQRAKRNPTQLNSAIQGLISQMEQQSDQIFQKQLREEFTDFYRVLGVSRSATVSDIKKEYFKKARTMHPDTVPQNATKEEKEAMSKKYAKVAAAYEVLSDPDKKQQFDQGTYGIEEQNNKREAHEKVKMSWKQSILNAR